MVQGGWRPERWGNSKMQVKLRCDELRQALAKAEQEVHSLECSVQQLQDRVNQHEQGLEERAQVCLASCCCLGGVSLATVPQRVWESHTWVLFARQELLPSRRRWNSG